MGIKVLKPTTPGRRGMTVSDFSEITKKEPEKSLVVGKKQSTGRNCYGRITSWRRGGGHKRRYRIIDFKRDKFDIPAKVAAIEYDPNRSARIALLHYVDGEKRYIICPKDLSVGDVVISSTKADIKVGNALPMENIPAGTIVHNIELHPGRGGQLCRAAGTYAQILDKEEKYVLLRLPSGEVRKVLAKCMATIGQVGNIDHENITIGKAGRYRYLNRRPYVRGVAMNPIDHPHGGGEGKSSGGRHPCTPWGVPTKGYKTRKKKKYSDKYIVTRRKK